MEPEKKQSIVDICKGCGNDRSRLMDIAIAVQNKYGQISGEAMEIISRELKTHRVEVESVVTFYAFLNEQPKGRVVIRVCNDVVDRMFGADLVERAFEQALGIKVGQTTADSRFTLERTACLGMSDQAPAALVNDVIVTDLTPQKAHEVVRELASSMDPKKLVTRLGDGNNAHPLVQAMVKNNIKKTGGVLFADSCCGRKAFDAAFRREMGRVIPGAKLAPLPLDSPVYRSTGTPIVKADFSARLKQQYPDWAEPRLEGITLNGLVGVIYSPIDVGCGWEDAEHPYSLGYEKKTGLRLGASVLLYAMTH